jgi:hypothetical protein
MELICPLTDVQRADTPGSAPRAGAAGRRCGRGDAREILRLPRLLTRLRQTCCDPDMLPWRKAPLTDSGKINLLIEKLAEIVGSGHKAVIFSQFVMLLDRVREALTPVSRTCRDSS